MAGPLIVTAEFAPADFVWFDKQRREHFPNNRNRLAAHFTMFHALPPSVEAELRGQLKGLASAAPPRATITGLINLGGGVAYRIVSDELEEIRAAVADQFHGSLTAQDNAGWRPHVTIQNKVSAAEARALLEALEREYRPRALNLRGLALHRYAGGPWETLGRYAFRG